MQHCCFGSVHNKHWIIDSGVTDYMCHDFQMFTTLHTITQSIIISLPDGTTIIVAQVGIIKLSSTLQHLQDVLYTPSFQFNLLYVSKLPQDMHQ